MSAAAAEHASGVDWHLVGALAFGVLAVGGVALAERVQQLRAARLGGARLVLAAVVAAAWGLSAVIHLVVVPENLAEAWLYGAFFACCTAAQLGYAGLVLGRSTRPVLAAGVVANLGLLGLWLATRTVGLPWGPLAGEVEPVGALDVAAGAVELVAIAAAIGLAALPVRSSADPARGPTDRRSAARASSAPRAGAAP